MQKASCENFSVKKLLFVRTAAFSLEEAPTFGRDSSRDSLQLVKFREIISKDIFFKGGNVRAKRSGNKVIPAVQFGISISCLFFSEGDNRYG